MARVKDRCRLKLKEKILWVSLALNTIVNDVAHRGVPTSTARSPHLFLQMRSENAANNCREISANPAYVWRATIMHS